MRYSVKRWCKEFGYTWYGPGKYSNETYDYKILFGKGQDTAMFRSFHGPCDRPMVYTTKQGKEFLIFPVISQFVGRKEMSRAMFIKAINWVKASLLGEEVFCSMERK